MTTLSPVLKETPPCCWLIEWDGLKLGVHRKGGWYARFRDEWVLFDAEYKCVHLLPVLEFDRDEFFAFLNRAEILFPDYASGIKNFPMLLLFRLAFCGRCSDYWAELAMTWLERDPCHQPSLKADLEELSVNKLKPQRLRHRARKIARRLSANAA